MIEKLVSLYESGEWPEFVAGGIITVTIDLGFVTLHLASTKVLTSDEVRVILKKYFEGKGVSA